MALSDGRVLLRPLQTADVEAIYVAVVESIPELSRWLPWCHPGYSRSNTLSFIESTAKAWADGTQFQFGIFDAVAGTYQGGLGISHLVGANQLANAGYWVRTGSTRQGIAPAALRLAARYAFSQLGLTRLEIVCIPENTYSRRVAEKVGARFEAVARNRLIMRGRPYDAALYALLPSDLDD